MRSVLAIWFGLVVAAGTGCGGSAGDASAD